MKHIKRLYFVPFLFAVSVGAVMVYFLFPQEQYWQTGLCILVPMLISAIGFRLITIQRLRTIRNQLYQILQTLETFDVDEPEKVEFEPSPFSIFNELNEYLIELINRIRQNYQSNKEFTQNASHELQTPLAIIKGNIELLLQSPHLGEKEIKALGVVLQNTNRLSRLNSALILLAKIEHQSFGDTENVEFGQLTQEVIHNFQDAIDIQELQVTKDNQTPFRVSMSRTLAEVLIANLVQNAIRHNIKRGSIQVQVTATHFIISNPGKELDVSPKVLFKRFRRESDNESSLGLGLSIVKRICEQSSLNIEYLFKDNWHSLKITKS